MSSKPFRRHAGKKREPVDAGSLAKLYDVGPYRRNEITLSQINRLRDMIELIGREAAAQRIGVCVSTMLAVTSGLGHKLRPETAAAVRAFLDGGK